MTNHDRSAHAGDDEYSPFSRVEDRTQRVPELLALLVALAGLFLQGGRAGALAGLLLVACWMYLQVEFVFAAGTALFVGVGGDPLSTGTILTLAGLGGLLAVDLARTWRSIKPVALFLALFVVGVGGLLVASQTVPGLQLGVGAAVTIAGVGYLFHRYERIRFGIIDTSGNVDEERIETSDGDESAATGGNHDANATRDETT